MSGAPVPSLAELERAASEAPGDPAAWLALADGAYRAGRLRQAETATSRALELGPADGSAWLLAGQVRRAAGQLAAAEAAPLTVHETSFASHPHRNARFRPRPHVNAMAAVAVPPGAVLADCQ